MSSNDLTAWATVVLAAVTVPMSIATIALAIAAWRQLPIFAAQARENAKRQRESDTLRACLSFDTDPVIFAASQRVWNAANGGIFYRGNPKIPRHDVMVIVNYLDGIAIGARDGFFDEAIVWAHLGPTITKMVETILPELFDGTDDYQTMAALYRRFASVKPVPGEPPIESLRDAIADAGRLPNGGGVADE